MTVGKGICQGSQTGPGSPSVKGDLSNTPRRQHVQETSTDQPAFAAKPPASGQRPLLIYDGDCGFCVYSVRYWQKLTGDAVEYRPYQDVAAQFPDIG